ncbi:MAG: RdgB/HAM1 family non-canonical purine NTP pyrophosphatase [Anaerovoracaceae bacterium]
MIIVAATQNEHKIEEIHAITAPFGFEMVSRSDAGVPDFEVEEDGRTFEENSLKKAMEIHMACGLPTIADDSGLMVDSLDGAPGVYSARFAGEEGDDAKNNEKLLDLLTDVPPEKRQGKFVSVITMVFSPDDILVARGECPGNILYSVAGDNGFGYDPIFAPTGYEQSFGQLPKEVKNSISHRARALQSLQEQLKLRK